MFKCIERVVVDKGTTWLHIHTKRSIEFGVIWIALSFLFEDWGTGSQTIDIIISKLVEVAKSVSIRRTFLVIVPWSTEW